MNCVKRVGWTDLEEELLNKHYKDGYDVLVEKGLKRSKGATILKARRMGLHTAVALKNEWSEEDVIILVEAYKEYNVVTKIPTELVELLGRKEDSIMRKAYNLGLWGKGNEGVLWNKERLDIMEKYYELEGVKGVKKRGIKEPKDIILAKAIEMGYSIKF